MEIAGLSFAIDSRPAAEATRNLDGMAAASTRAQQSSQSLQTASERMNAELQRTITTQAKQIQQLQELLKQQQQMEAAVRQGASSWSGYGTAVASAAAGLGALAIGFGPLGAGLAAVSVATGAAQKTLESFAEAAVAAGAAMGGFVKTLATGSFDVAPLKASAAEMRLIMVTTGQTREEILKATAGYKEWEERLKTVNRLQQEFIVRQAEAGKRAEDNNPFRPIVKAIQEASGALDVFLAKQALIYQGATDRSDSPFGVTASTFGAPGRGVFSRLGEYISNTASNIAGNYDPGKLRPVVTPADKALADQYTASLRQQEYVLKGYADELKRVNELRDKGLLNDQAYLAVLGDLKSRYSAISYEIDNLTSATDRYIQKRLEEDGLLKKKESAVGAAVLAGQGLNRTTSALSTPESRASAFGNSIMPGLAEYERTAADAAKDLAEKTGRVNDELDEQIRLITELSKAEAAAEARRKNLQSTIDEYGAPIKNMRAWTEQQQRRKETFDLMLRNARSLEASGAALTNEEYPLSSNEIMQGRDFELRRTDAFYRNQKRLEGERAIASLPMSEQGAATAQLQAEQAELNRNGQSWKVRADGIIASQQAIYAGETAIIRQIQAGTEAMKSAEKVAAEPLKTRAQLAAYWSAFDAAKLVPGTSDTDADVLGHQAKGRVGLQEKTAAGDATSQLALRVSGLQRLAAAERESAQAGEKMRIELEAAEQALRPGSIDKRTYATKKLQEAEDQRTVAAATSHRQTNEQVSSQLKLVDAYEGSAAEIMKARAEQEAELAVIGNVINKRDQQARANDNLRKSLAELVTQTAASNHAMREEVSIMEEANRISKRTGVSSGLSRDLAQEQRRNSDLRQAAGLADGIGDREAAKALTNLADQQERLNKARRDAQTIGDLQSQNQGYRDQLALSQKELELVSALPEQRQMEIEKLRIILDLKRRGIDLEDKTLDPEKRKEAEEMIRLAGAVGKVRGETERARQEMEQWRQVGDHITERLVDGFTSSGNAVKDFGKLAIDTFREIAKNMIIRPLIAPMVYGALGVPTPSMPSIFGPTQASSGGGGLLSLLGQGAAQKAGGSLLDKFNPFSSLTNMFSGGNNFLSSMLPSIFGPGVATTATMAPATLAAMMPGEIAAMSGTVGAMGSAPGMLAGMAPMLPVLAIALPLLLSMFMKKKPSVGPNANATVGMMDGIVGITSTGADNGGDKGPAIELANESIKALMKTIRSIGGSLGAGGLPNGLQVGHFKGKYFVDDTGMGGTARYDQNQFEDGGAAVADFLRRALAKADIAGISDTMKTVLQKTTAKSLEDLGKDLDFAQLYERDFKAADQMKEALKALSTTFDEYTDQAKRLGLDMSKVTEAFVRERKKLTEEFEKSSVSSILSMSSPAVASFLAMMDSQKKRVDDARTLGASLVAVERQNYLERRAFILSLGEEQRKIFLAILPLADQLQAKLADAMSTVSAGIIRTTSALQGAHDATANAANSFRALGQSLRQTQAALKLSNLSPLSPGDKLAEAKKQFDELKTKAMAGDQGAAGKLNELARSYLEIGQQNYASGPQYASIYDEVQRALGDAAIVQDVIAIRLDIQVALMGTQIDILKAIQKAIEDNAKLQDSTDSLSRLGVAGTVTEFEKTIYEAIVDDLKTKLPTTDPLQAQLGQLRGTVSDGRISEEEAATSRGSLDALRLRFYTDLQTQLGPDSALIRGFTLLNAAMSTAASSASSLSAAVTAMGTTYTQLAGILDAAVITNGVDIGQVATDVANLINAIGGETTVAAQPVLSTLVTDFNNLGNTLRNHEGRFSTSELNRIGTDFTGLGGRLISDTTGIPAVNSAMLIVVPSINTLIGSFSNMASPNGNGAIANMKTAMDLLKVAMEGAHASLNDPTVGLLKALEDFRLKIAALIATIGGGGGSNPTMPSIDRTPLAGDTMSKFQTLANRAVSFHSAASGAGFSEAQITNSDAWQWAVSQRKSIISGESSTGSLEALLASFYGNTRQRTAYTGVDQGINEILDRMATLGASSGGGAGTGMAASYRQWLKDNPYQEGEGGQHEMAPDDRSAEMGLRSLSLQGVAPSWYPKFRSWWDAGHVVADLDKYAMGGIVNGATLFRQGSGRMGLMGEAGPEGILPLARMSGGQLGVRSTANDNEWRTANELLRGVNSTLMLILRENQALRESFDAYRGEQDERDTRAMKQVDDRAKKRRLAGERDG